MSKGNDSFASGCLGLIGICLLVVPIYYFGFWNTVKGIVLIVIIGIGIVLYNAYKESEKKKQEEDEKNRVKQENDIIDQINIKLKENSTETIEEKEYLILKKVLPGHCIDICCGETQKRKNKLLKSIKKAKKKVDDSEINVLTPYIFEVESQIKAFDTGEKQIKSIITDFLSSNPKIRYRTVSLFIDRISDLYDGEQFFLVCDQAVNNLQKNIEKALHAQDDLIVNSSLGTAKDGSDNQINNLIFECETIQKDIKSAAESYAKAVNEFSY